MTLTIFLGALLGPMALGVPIAFALILSGVALMMYMGIFDAQIVAQNVMNGADSFPLMAVPFFLLAGEVMNTGGLSRRIVNLAMALVGHVRGGLGFVAIFAACILSSLSGSAVADAAALGALLYPITGNPTWTCTYDNTQDSVVSTAIGNGGSDTDIIDHFGSLNVSANVLKTNNDGFGPDGFPTADGWVEWLRNGVQVNTELFNTASNTSSQGLNFTYTTVSAFEILRVVVHEDGTSP